MSLINGDKARDNKKRRAREKQRVKLRQIRAAAASKEQKKKA